MADKKSDKKTAVDPTAFSGEQYAQGLPDRTYDSEKAAYVYGEAPESKTDEK